MKKSIFQSIILLALIMVLACLFYLTPDKKSKNSHPVSSGSVSYIKPGSGIGGGDINGNAVAGKKSLPIYCVKHDDSEKFISISCFLNKGSTYGKYHFPLYNANPPQLIPFALYIYGKI